MSHTRVKTSYEEEGSFGGTEVKTLYCHHNHSCDYVTFYDGRGEVMDMSFCSWSTGNDLWDAVNRLWYPFKDKWGEELKDGVTYYINLPDPHDIEVEDNSVTRFDPDRCAPLFYDKKEENE